MRHSHWVMRRCLGATGVFLLVFMTATIADSIRIQLDVPDAATAPAPDAGLLVGTLLGLAGVALAFALIRDRPEDATARLAPRPPPSDAPRLAQDVTTPWEAAQSGVDIAAAVTLGVAVVLLLALAPLAGWPLLLLVPPLVAVGLLFGRYRVVVDEHGLAARSFGRRILHVPLAQVAVASEVLVTTDDADAAAALLNTLADQRILGR